MAKVSKNARVAQRAANAGSGRDFVKVVKSIKNEKYTLTNSTLQKLVLPYCQKTHILNLNGFRYFQIKIYY